MSQSAAPENADMFSNDLNNLDEALRAFVDQGKVAGLVTLIARDGQIIHQACYGRLNLATGSPIAWNSLFRIASLTKPITAVATLMLHEQGYFDLHDPISKWIRSLRPQSLAKRRGYNV